MPCVGDDHGATCLFTHSDGGLVEHFLGSDRDSGCQKSQIAWLGNGLSSVDAPDALNTIAHQIGSNDDEEHADNQRGKRLELPMSEGVVAILPFRGDVCKNKYHHIANKIG